MKNEMKLPNRLKLTSRLSMRLIRMRSNELRS